MAKRLNILFLTQHFPPEPTGGAIHTYEMVKYLSDRNVTIDVITTFPTYPYGSFSNLSKVSTDLILEERQNVNIKRIWTYRPQSPSPKPIQRNIQYSIFALNALLHTLFKKKYDVVITSQPPEFILLTGLVLKKVKGSLWVADVRDLWFEAAVALGYVKERSISYALFNLFRRIALQNVDVLAHTSTQIKLHLTQKYNLQCKTIPNPNGVNPAEYPHSADMGNNLIYVGNLGYQYHFDNFIEALTLIDENIELTILGGGDQRLPLEKKVEQLKIQNRVHFIDSLPHDQVLKAICAARIGICPLRTDSSLRSVLPIKVLEYMGCGKPFITTGIGEIELLVRDSTAGILVNDSPEAIAEAIERIYDDAEKYREMSASGLKYVNANFNKISIINNLFEEILKKLQ